MSFLAPWMLWGVAAASLPVILHFFYRSRYRTVPWAAMKFLLTSIEQTSRRLRFQELLLLVARTALLVLLALALARPSTTARSGSGGGDAVDAVFLFDTSYSMGAREGAATRLERARAAALAVIDHLPPHSTVQVVACADRAASLGPVAASNLEQAREVVRAVELTHLATDLFPGAAEAAAALARGHSPNREFYLFSDMQRSGWDAQAAALKKKLEEIRRQAAVTLVRCGTREPRNVAVVGIAAQSGIPHTGERAGFAVLVRNSGREPVRDLAVTLEIDGRARDRETQAIAVLAPGETQAVALSGKLDRPGLRVLSAAVAADELDADNRFHRVVHVRDQARVLVVDGAPSEARPEAASAFYLLHSLRPVPESAWGGYHVQPRTVGPLEAAAALLSDADACILVNAAVQPAGESNPGALPHEFVERLGGFVREGRGVLVFAGPRVSPELYNRVLFDETGLLPYRLTAPEGAPATPQRPDPASIDARSFLSPFREEPLSRLDQVNVAQWIGLEARAGEDARVLLRTGTGTPLLASRRAGAGEVLFVTTSADPRWCDWPLRHTYLPFVHAALGHLLGGTSEPHNRTAGEPLRWRPSAADAGRVHFAVGPDGRRVRLGVAELVDGLPAVSTARTSRAGIYRIAPEAPADREAEGAIFAATPDLRESEDLEALGDRQLDERLGFPVHHLVAGDDLTVFQGAERLKREWTLWILLAVLAIALFETALAWHCGRGW